MHSAVAEQIGLDADERARAQRFDSEDPKRAAALYFAKEVIENRGKPSDEAFQEAKDAGWTDEEIIEIVGHVVMNTFTNYMNDTMQTEVDFPRVEPVHSK